MKMSSFLSKSGRICVQVSAKIFCGLISLLISSPAYATWSITAVDNETGEVGVATSTCLPFILSGDGRLLYRFTARGAIVPGVAVATSQGGLLVNDAYNEIHLSPSSYILSPEVTLRALVDRAASAGIDNLSTGYPYLNTKQWSVVALNRADLAHVAATWTGTQTDFSSETIFHTDFNGDGRIGTGVRGQFNAGVFPSQAGSSFFGATLDGTGYLSLDGMTVGNRFTFTVQGNTLSRIEVLEAARDAFANGDGTLVDRLMRALLAGGGRNISGAVLRNDMGDIRCVEESPDPSRPNLHAPSWQAFIAVAKSDDTYLPDSPDLLYFFRASRGSNNLNALEDLRSQYQSWVDSGRPYKAPIISGQVLDKNGIGWMHTTLDLHGFAHDGKLVDAFVLSDEDGNFEFRNLPPSNENGYLVQPREYYVSGERFDPLRVSVEYPGAPHIRFTETLGKGLGSDRIQPNSSRPLKTITGVVLNSDGVSPAVGVPVELHKAAGDIYREDLRVYTDNKGRFTFKHLLTRDRESGPAGEVVDYTVYVRHAVQERQIITGISSSSPDTINMDGTNYNAFLME